MGMMQETIQKPVETVKVGQTVQTEDGFTLYYMTVERIETDDNGDFTLHGKDNGEDGELYFSVGELVDVVVEDDQATVDAAVATEDARIGTLEHDGDTLEPVHDAPEPAGVIRCTECNALPDPSMRVDGDNPFSAGDYCQTEHCPGRYYRALY